MRLPVILCLALIVLSNIACEEQKATVTKDYYSTVPDELKPVFEKHGGLDKWNEMSALTYTLNRGEKNEVHKVDLKNRKVNIQGKGFTLGFDGEQVWVSPNKSAFGGSSARFYHNLIFYFYAMPFVLADPGINYEVMEPAEILGKMYNKVRISYKNGVGDAPDDEYIICYDPETHQMEWLLYTVTYFSKEKSKKYNALHYDNWKDINGLLLPSTMVGYRTSNDSITEKRYESLYEDITLSSEAFDQQMFEMPEVAEIDSLQ